MPKSYIRCAVLALVGVCAVAAPVRVTLVGDSTVAEDGGWGPGFRASFGPPVETTNLAANGRSSKSFRAEKRWDAVIAGKPDYVLIQFGHNDVPGKGPDRETDAATTFRENMARYVDEARAAGATPVLVTSIVRRNFDSGGTLRVDSLAPYVNAVRALAAERRIPLIDLYRLTVRAGRKAGRSRMRSRYRRVGRPGQARPHSSGSAGPGGDWRHGSARVRRPIPRPEALPP